VPPFHADWLRAKGARVQIDRGTAETLFPRFAPVVG
jgi:hypothetical protein